MILVLLTTKRTSCISCKEWEIRTRWTKDSVASIILSKIQCLTLKMFQVVQSSRGEKVQKAANKVKKNRISLLILLYKLFSGKTGLKSYGQRALLSCGPTLPSLTYCHHWLTCSQILTCTLICRVVPGIHWASLFVPKCLFQSSLCLTGTSAMRSYLLCWY